MLFKIKLGEPVMSGSYLVLDSYLVLAYLALALCVLTLHLPCAFLALGSCFLQLNELRRGYAISRCHFLHNLRGHD